MRKEYRVYGVDCNEADLPATDQQFMSEAERQGYVWTLKSFEHDFNIDDLRDTMFIRILPVFIKETKDDDLVLEAKDVLQRHLDDWYGIQPFVTLGRMFDTDLIACMNNEEELEAELDWCRQEWNDLELQEKIYLYEKYEGLLDY